MESIASNYTANEGDKTVFFNRRTDFYEQIFMDIFVDRASIPFLQGCRAETGSHSHIKTCNTECSGLNVPTKFYKYEAREIIDSAVFRSKEGGEK